MRWVVRSKLLWKWVILLLVSDAAKKLGMNTQTLRLALQQDKCPFGYAVKTSPKRFTYYINPERLEKYIMGEI